MEKVEIKSDQLKERKEIDILIKFYEKNIEFGMHHERQRFNAINLMLLLSGIIVGLISFDNSINTTDTILAIFIIVLGVLTILFNLKHRERFYLHYRRAKAYIRKIDELNLTFSIKEIQLEGDKLHSSKDPVLFSLRLYWIWNAFGISLIIIGLIVIGLYFNLK